MLAFAWLALHIVLGVALAATAVPAWAKAASFAALLANVLGAKPAVPPACVWRADGAVELGADAYALDGATTYTGSWVRLRLKGPIGAPREIVLFRDQIDAGTWSRLQARLRRGPR
jgi:hypothetical protein